jgi:rubrerythrin
MPRSLELQKAPSLTPTQSPKLPWRLEDIDLAAIEHDKVRDDEMLFYLLVTSSFVEIASDLYTRNLSAYYTGDDDLLRWLGCHWEQEELQHGRALRAYVQAVWPEFDWDAANASFFRDYSARCTLDAFEPSRGLELAARCMVETGTATFYRTIYAYTDEPVLKAIAGHIKSDEVRHYSHFWRFFNLYRAREPVSRWRVLYAVLKRVAEARNDDALVAFQHAFSVRHPHRPFERRIYDEFHRRFRQVMRAHFPFDMAVKMLLKPLGLPAGVQRTIVPVLTRIAGLALI